jgi:hypothetical protein
VVANSSPYVKCNKGSTQSSQTRVLPLPHRYYSSVGLALGMQDAGSFVSLLLAVIVHQMLEGLGIGATALEVCTLLVCFCARVCACLKGALLKLACLVCARQSCHFFTGTISHKNCAGTGDCLLLHCPHRHRRGHRAAHSNGQERRNVRVCAFRQRAVSTVYDKHVL